MADFDDPAFTGDNWARRYPDSDLSEGPDPTAAVDFLAELAGDGARVLELAIGGGGVARPLRRRGLRVEGVEASATVAKRLATSPEGTAIPVVVADMADVPVTGLSDWSLWCGTACSTSPARPGRSTASATSPAFWHPGASS